jgi:hypothetical protein
MMGAMEWSAWFSRGQHVASAGIAHALGRVADLLSAGFSITAETPEAKTLTRRLDALSARERVAVDSTPPAGRLLAEAMWLERDLRDGNTLTSASASVVPMLAFLRRIDGAPWARATPH